MTIRSSSGFSLIELSILIVVFGLITATVYPAITRSLEWGQYSKAKETVATARDEIIGHALIHSELPNSLTSIGHRTDTWHQPHFYCNATNLGNICSFNATNSTTSLRVITAQNATVENVAFVIGSRGSDKRLDSDHNSTTVTFSTDDIMEFVTLEYLRTQLSCPD
jgi:type II secretory pathway pseudopilin PulG